MIFGNQIRGANNGCRLSSRRWNIYTYLSFACFFLFRTVWSAESVFPNGVACGDTTFNSTVLWARSALEGELEFVVATDPDFEEIVWIEDEEVDSINVPVKLSVHDLEPGVEYYYRVTHVDFGKFSVGRFRTPNLPGQLMGLRFGVGGDWRGDLSPYLAMRNVSERDLDFFVKLGDSVYVDKTSPALPASSAQTVEEFRLKYDEVYGSRFGINVFEDLHASTSIYAIIDDHEVRNNFAGGAPPSSDIKFPNLGTFINETQLYRNGLQVFHEFTAIRNEIWQAEEDPRFHGKPKLYRFQTFGNDAALFLLDTRSFRDASLEPVSNIMDPRSVEEFKSRSFDMNPQTGESLPARTLLGRLQLETLQRDLLKAHRGGIVWKFVCFPNPIQNLGIYGAPDRFEGYTAERTELLQFIDEHAIQNVVFIAADIHGASINNLSYQSTPDGPQRPLTAFEVVTPAVAADTLDPTLLSLADSIPVTDQVSFLDLIIQGLGLSNRIAFDSLPSSIKNAALAEFINNMMTPFGLDPLGLKDSPISVVSAPVNSLLAFQYGWTEFEVDAETQNLMVTIYGMDSYSPEEVGPDLVLRRPEILERFTVSPQPPVLNVSLEDAVLTISWQNSALELQLESTDFLDTDSVWERTANVPQIEGNHLYVTIPLDEATAAQTQFFRLVHASP